jgi:hypothetical protein
MSCTEAGRYSRQSGAEARARCASRGSRGSRASVRTAILCPGGKVAAGGAQLAGAELPKGLADRLSRGLAPQLEHLPVTPSSSQRDGLRHAAHGQTVAAFHLTSHLALLSMERCDPRKRHAHIRLMEVPPGASSHRSHVLRHQTRKT